MWSQTVDVLNPYDAMLASHDEKNAPDSSMKETENKK